MKVNLKNVDKVNATLEAVQRRAKVRLIYSTHVNAAIERIENRLKTLKVPKKEWVGIVVTDQRLERFAGAYKWAPEATHFTIQRFKSGWFLVACERNDCEGNPEKSLRFLNELSYQHLYQF
jgi:hypothetical protein